MGKILEPNPSLRPEALEVLNQPYFKDIKSDINLLDFLPDKNFQ